MDRVLEIVLRARDEASAELEKVGKEAGGLQKMFAGSFKNAALISGAAIGGLAAAAVTSVGAFNESQAAVAQMDAVLKSTGNAADVTKAELLEQAAAIQTYTQYSDEAVMSAQNMLLTFTNIKGGDMLGAVDVVLDMSTALGTDLKSSAIQVGKALNDPINGVSALQRVGVTFTEGQKEMIKSMVDAGETGKAQAFIMAELRKEFGGSAAAAGQTFAGQMKILSNTIGEVQEKFGGLIVGAITPYVGKLKDVATVVSEVVAGKKSLSDLTKQLGESFGILGTAIGRVIEFFATHREAVIAVAGAFAGFLSIAIIGATIAIAGFIGVALPVIVTFMAIGAAIALVGTHLSQVKSFINEHQTALTVLAGIIGTLMIPLFIAMGHHILLTGQHFAATALTHIGGYILRLQVAYTTGLAFITSLVAKIAHLAMAGVAFAAHTAATIAGTIATVAMTAATWAFNVALLILTSPIALVVIAIVALIAIGVLLMRNWDTVKASLTDLGSKFTGFMNRAREVADTVLGAFRRMADGITGALRSIKFPHLKIGSGNITVMGKNIGYPTIDVDWYEKGGYVPETGLAMLHAGEYVLSKDMLNGRVPGPSNYNYNTPINIGPVIMQGDADVETLAQRLGFYFDTAGDL